MKGFKRAQALAFAMVLALFSSVSRAAPPDFSDLTDAVDFSTLNTALLAVFAALAAVFILLRGGSLILAKIRR
ncbi:hypothetical protein [Methylomonas koyamae]|uniref:Uncharacterized protein n=1 Tax=Methylomonas koyamae TaxID=702114 RepID=A0A291IJN8_9GAMM|nr:hypothetical protein [Methylomonas koyamae]ATG90522.1 hypothetical protein MKLM6_2299 [Methylomonas koyamae]OAI22726.1 hypothetical protein A1356_18965 [Methylomonas koyamae]